MWANILSGRSFCKQGYGVTSADWESVHVSQNASHVRTYRLTSFSLHPFKKCVIFYLFNSFCCFYLFVCLFVFLICLTQEGMKLIIYESQGDVWLPLKYSIDPKADILRQNLLRCQDGGHIDHLARSTQDSLLTDVSCLPFPSLEDVVLDRQEIKRFLIK